MSDMQIQGITPLYGARGTGGGSMDIVVVPLMVAFLFAMGLESKQKAAAASAAINLRENIALLAPELSDEQRSEVFQAVAFSPERNRCLAVSAPAKQTCRDAMDQHWQKLRIRPVPQTQP